MSQKQEKSFKGEISESGRKELIEKAVSSVSRSIQIADAIEELGMSESMIKAIYSTYRIDGHTYVQM